MHEKRDAKITVCVGGWHVRLGHSPGEEYICSKWEQVVWIMGNWAIGIVPESMPHEDEYSKSTVTELEFQTVTVQGISININKEHLDYMWQMLRLVYSSARKGEEITIPGVGIIYPAGGSGYMVKKD